MEKPSCQRHGSSAIINFHGIISAIVRAVERLIYTAIRYDILFAIVCPLDIQTFFVVVSNNAVIRCSDHDKTFLLAFRRTSAEYCLD